MPRATFTPVIDLQAALDEFGHSVSLSDAARLAGCSRRTIERCIERGELPLYRIGSTRTLRARTADVVALFERVA